MKGMKESIIGANSVRFHDLKVRERKIFQKIFIRLRQSVKIVSICNQRGRKREKIKNRYLHTEGKEKFLKNFTENSLKMTQLAIFLIQREEKMLKKVQKNPSKRLG